MQGMRMSRSSLHRGKSIRTDTNRLLEKLVAFHNNESRINTGTRVNFR